MRKLLKKSLLLAVTAFLASLSATAATNVNGIYYTFSGTEAAVTYASSSYNSYSGDVVIPSTVTYGSTTYTVTAINIRAFKDCTGLTSVTIPTTVASIGIYAFDGCSALTSIVIPSGITSVSNYAFRNCTSLEKVEIECDSAATFSSYLFYGDTSIKTFYSYATNPATASSATFNSTTADGDAILYVPEGCVDTYSAATGWKKFATIKEMGDTVTYSTTYWISGDINSWATDNADKYGFTNNGDGTHTLSLTSLSGKFKIVTNSGATSYGYGTIALDTDYTLSATGDTISLPYTEGTYNNVTFTLTETDSLLSLKVSAESYTAPEVVYYLAGDFNSWATADGSYAFSNNDDGTYTLVTASSGFTTSTGFKVTSSTGLSLGYTGSLSYDASYTLTTDGGNATLAAAPTGDNLYFTLTVGDEVYSLVVSEAVDDSDLANFVVDGIYYVINDDRSTVSVASPSNGYYSGEVIVPSVVAYKGKSYSVTAIADKAFYSSSSMTELTIGEGVTSVGTSAFYGCTKLAAVSLPSTLKTLGRQAFYNCSALTSLVIPSSVDSLGASVLANCKGLVSLTLPDSIAYLPDRAFYYCSALDTLVIPNTVTAIGSSVFYYCSSLKSLTLSESLTELPDKAFYNLGLTSIIIPNSVKTVGEYLFYYCESLKTVTLPDSLTYLSSRMFYNCSAIESIELPAVLDSIASHAFYQCTSLKSIAFPSPLKTIGASAFYHCSALESVTFNDALKMIDTRGFYACSSLKTVTLPSSLDSLGAYAFYSCSSLTSLYIPESVTIYPDYMCYGCSSLKSVNFHDKMTSLGKYAFYNCSSITEANLPNSIRTLGRYAFFACTSLATVTLPRYITVIDNYTFLSCPFTSITIPPCVTHINSGAFAACTNLKSIEIPDSVIFIGGASFNQCYALASVGINYTSQLDSIDLVAFANCTSLASFYIPKGVSYIGEGAFLYCKSMTEISVESENSHYASYDGVLYNYGYTALICCPAGKTTIDIPNTVTRFENYALAYCWNISSIVIPELVTEIGDYGFYGCYGFRTMYCNPTTPPTCGEYCFDYSYASTNATLYVPVGTKAVYSSTSPWSDFINIVEDDSGSVEAIAEDEVAVTAVNGEIVISGADGQYVAVYTTAGQIVYSGYGNTTAVPSSGIYIVKVGASTFKLRL